MGPLLVVAAFVLFVVAPAIAHWWRIRRAERACEAETLVRIEEEGQADVQPHEALQAIEQLLDVPGVSAVYRRRDSNLVYVLAQTRDERELRQLRDAVRWTTPIGLSAMVVSDKGSVPEECMCVAKGWAA